MSSVIKQVRRWRVNYLGFYQSLIKRNLINSCYGIAQCIMSLPLSPFNMVSRRLKAASKEVTIGFFRWRWWFLWMLWTVLRRPTISSFTESPLIPRSSCKCFVTCTAILASVCFSSDFYENKTQSFNNSSWNEMQFVCEVVMGKRTVQLSALFSTAASRTSW